MDEQEKRRQMPNGTNPEAARAMKVSREWIDNHFNVAERIALAIEGFVARHRLDLDEYVAELTTADWSRFALIAGQRGDYTPSTETRIFVVRLLGARRLVRCIDCDLRAQLRNDVKCEGCARVGAEGRA